MQLPHLNKEGRARMVDVSEKAVTLRTATAMARVRMNPETFALVESGGIRKGDVLAVAQVAGIMAAKKTADVIPMCHPIALTGADVSFRLDRESCTVEIQASSRCRGETGVEMEALTAASVAALTIYDMCKAVQRDIVIEEICLLEKAGGKSGVFSREAT